MTIEDIVASLRWPLSECDHAFMIGTAWSERHWHSVGVFDQAGHWKPIGYEFEHVHEAVHVMQQINDLIKATRRLIS